MGRRIVRSSLQLRYRSAENCRWLSDEHDNYLFTLKIKWDSVSCAFNKESLYFTFPVITKRICQILMHFHSILWQRCVLHKRYIGKAKSISKLKHTTVDNFLVSLRVPVVQVEMAVLFSSVPVVIFTGWGKNRSF